MPLVCLSLAASHGAWMGALAVQRLLYSVRRPKIRQYEQVLHRHYELLMLRRHPWLWRIGYGLGFLLGIGLPLPNFRQHYLASIQKQLSRPAVNTQKRTMYAKISQETQDIP
jgi:hypothetical protein